MSIRDERLKEELNSILGYTIQNPYASPEDVLGYYIEQNAQDQDLLNKLSELRKKTSDPYLLLAEAVKYKAGNTSIGEEFLSGLKSSLYSSAYDLGLLGKALYNSAYNYITGEEKPLTEGNLLSYLREKAEETAPSVTSLRQALTSPDEFMRFAAGGLGNAASFFLPTIGLEALSERLIGRGLAGLVGRDLANKVITEGVESGLEKGIAKKLLNKEIEDAIASTTKGKIAQAIGRATLPYLGMSGIEAGETLRNQLETGQVDIGKAAAGGLLGGALEYMPYGYLSSKLFKFGDLALSGERTLKKVLGIKALNTLKEGLTTGIFEGLTEGLQSLTERLFGGKDIATQEAIEEYINSVALGLVSGGGLGGIVGLSEKIATTPANEEITESSNKPIQPELPVGAQYPVLEPSQAQEPGALPPAQQKLPETPIALPPAYPKLTGEVFEPTEKVNWQSVATIPFEQLESEFKDQKLLNSWTTDHIINYVSEGSPRDLLEPQDLAHVFKAYNRILDLKDNIKRLPQDLKPTIRAIEKDVTNKIAEFTNDKDLKAILNRIPYKPLEKLTEKDFIRIITGKSRLPDIRDIQNVDKSIRNYVKFKKTMEALGRDDILDSKPFIKVAFKFADMSATRVSARVAEYKRSKIAKELKELDVPIEEIARGKVKEENIRKITQNITKNPDFADKLAYGYTLDEIAKEEKTPERIFPEEVAHKAELTQVRKFGKEEYKLAYSDNVGRFAVYLPKDVNIKSINKELKTRTIPAKIIRDGKVSDVTLSRTNTLNKIINNYKAFEGQKKVQVPVDEAVKVVEGKKEIQEKVKTLRNIQQAIEAKEKAAALGSKRAITKLGDIRTFFKNEEQARTFPAEHKLHLGRVTNFVEATKTSPKIVHELYNKVKVGKANLPYFMAIEELHDKGAKVEGDKTKYLVKDKSKLKLTPIGEKYLNWYSKNIQQLGKSKRETTTTISDKEFLGQISNIIERDLGVKKKFKNLSEVKKFINLQLKSADKELSKSYLKDKIRMSYHNKVKKAMIADYKLFKDMVVKGSKEDIATVITRGKPIKKQTLTEFMNTVARMEAILQKMHEEVTNLNPEEVLNVTKGLYSKKGKNANLELINLGKYRNMRRAVNEISKEIVNVINGLKKSIGDKKYTKSVKHILNTISLLTTRYKRMLDDYTKSIPDSLKVNDSELIVTSELVEDLGSVTDKDLIDVKELSKFEEEVKRDIHDLITIERDGQKKLVVSPEVLEETLFDTKSKYIKQIRSLTTIDEQTKANAMIILKQYYSLFRARLYTYVVQKIGELPKITESGVVQFTGDTSKIIDNDLFKKVANEVYDTLKYTIEDEIYNRILNHEVQEKTKTIMSMLESLRNTANLTSQQKVDYLNITSSISGESQYEKHGLFDVDEDRMKGFIIDNIIKRIGLERLPAKSLNMLKQYLAVLDTKVDDLEGKVEVAMTLKEFRSKNQRRKNALYKKYKKEIDSKIKIAEQYGEVSKETKDNLIFSTAYTHYLEELNNKSNGMWILSKESFKEKKGITDEKKLEEAYTNYKKERLVDIRRKALSSVPLKKLISAIKKIDPRVLRDIIIQTSDSESTKHVSSSPDLKFVYTPPDISNSLLNPKAKRDLEKAIAGISSALDSIFGKIDNLINIRFVKFVNTSHISVKDMKAALKYAYGYTDEQLKEMGPVGIRHAYEQVYGLIRPNFDKGFAATIIAALGNHESPSELFKTVMHEVFHFFERGKIISDKDIALLKEHFEDPKSNTAWFENAADAFSLFAQDIVGFRKHPRIRKIFKAVKNLLEKLGNWLRGYGFRSVESIFHDIYTGKTFETKYKNISSHDEFILHIKNNLMSHRAMLRLEDPIIHDKSHEDAERFLHNANVDYETTLTQIAREWRQNGLKGAFQSLALMGKDLKEYIANLLFRGALPKIFKSETAQEWEILREAMSVPNYAKAKAVRLIKEFVGDLSKEEYDLFNKIIVLRDVIKNVEKGIQSPEAVLQQLGGVYKSISDIKAHLRFLENKANNKVKNALIKRNKALQEILDDLYEKGYFKQPFKAEDYFHRMAITYYKLGRMSGITPKGMRLNFKAFLQKRYNATEMFITEYVLAEAELLAQAISLQEQHKLMERLKKVYEPEMQRVMKIFKKAAVREKGLVHWYQLFSPKYEKYLPEDLKEKYEVYFVADYEMPIPGVTLSKRKLRELMELALEKGETLASVTLDIEDLKPATMLVRIRRPLLVRKEVAETMENFMDYSNPTNSMAYNLFRTHMSALKRYLILNPFRAAHYMINNMAGDLDKVNIVSPKITVTYAPQAYKDVKAYFNYLAGKGPKPPKGVIEELEEAIRLGVVSSGLTAAEIPEIVTMEQLKDLLGYYDNSLVAKYWREIGRINNIRESILRLAVWRFFKDRLSKQPDKFGALASKREVYYNLKTTEEKAAMLARDLLGDYQNISPLGQFLRAYAIPFWSWMEVNAPSYFRVLKNAIQDGYKSGGVAGAFAHVFKRTMLMSTFYLLVAMYNVLRFPDEWKEALEANNGQLHLILWRRKDGSLATIRAQSALADALQWLGMEKLPLVTSLALVGNGDMKTFFKNELKGMLKNMPKAPINKIAQGFLPDVMAALESLGGYSFYPDITNWRPLRNHFDPFLRLAAIKTITDQFGFYPERPSSKGFANSLMTILWQTVGYDYYPDESRYFMAVKLGKEFLRVNKLSSGKFSYNVSPRANAAYYFKKALIYGDYENAEKFLARYFQLGGKLKNLKQSLRNSHPLSGIPLKYRKIFMDSLTENDRRIVNKAIDWYEKIILRHGKIPPRVWRALIRRARARAKQEGILKVDKAPYDLVF